MLVVASAGLPEALLRHSVQTIFLSLKGQPEKHGNEYLAEEMLITVASERVATNPFLISAPNPVSFLHYTPGSFLGVAAAPPVEGVGPSPPPPPPVENTGGPQPQPKGPPPSCADACTQNGKCDSGKPPADGKLGREVLLMFC